MNNNYRVIILLKPGETQPALSRVAQFSKFMPDIEVVACRVIHQFNESNQDTIKTQTEREIAKLHEMHPSIKNFKSLVVFNENVPDAFVQEANSGNFDLAIISANKRNTIKDLFISTIDCCIMRQIKVPLLVVKNENAPQRLGKAILLAIDFDEDNHDFLVDELLFEKAKLFADNFNGDIHVANVVSPLHHGLMSANTTMSALISNKNETRKDIHNRLLKEFAIRHGIEDDRTHVLIGRVDEEIPKLSRHLEARMVCMGTSSKSSLFGSINCNASELVLEQIRGDIFIVNSQECKSDNN